MTLKDCHNMYKSPKLKAIIVESILFYCISRPSFYQLVSMMRRTLPFSSSSPPSYNFLKKYLFHLIDYDLIKYNGQKQIFILAFEGFNLLNWIKREKSNMDTDDINDIFVTIE